MPAPVPIPEARRRELEEFHSKKCSGFELRRFLCVWLRFDQGMSAIEIAGALGMNANSIRIVQRRFIEEGTKVFACHKRGPKNPRLMTFEKESAFLEAFKGAAKDASMLIVKEIKAAWEEKLGQTVHQATLYRMLKRHGWRKVVPRPEHPKKDQKAVEAFKKGATQKGFCRQKQKGCP